jgi:hypothetical protein
MTLACEGERLLVCGRASGPGRHRSSHVRRCRPFGRRSQMNWLQPQTAAGRRGANHARAPPAGCESSCAGRCAA